MSEKYPYQKHWEEYRRRRNIFVFVFVSPLIFVTLPILLLNLSGFRFEKNLVTEILIFAVWIICFFSSRHYFHKWNCPQCRRRFFTMSFWVTSPVFLDCCRNCELPKYKGSTFYE